MHWAGCPTSGSGVSRGRVCSARSAPAWSVKARQPVVAVSSTGIAVSVVSVAAASRAAHPRASSRVRPTATRSSTGVLHQDAPGGGELQGGQRPVRVGAGDDDGGSGPAAVGGDQVEQLADDGGVRVGGVEQQHPGRPGVLAGLVGSCGDGVEVLVGGAVDRGERVGQDRVGHDRVRAAPSVGGGVAAAAGGRRCHWCVVGADPVWVERGEFGGGAGAVHRDAGGPGVAGDLGGDVPGQVGGVGGVPGQGDGEVFEVEQPRVAGVGGADGDQQRVRGGLSRFALSRFALPRQVGGGVGGQLPGAAVAAGVGPGVGQDVGGGQVRDHGGGGELDAGQGGHRLPGAGPGDGEGAQGVVDELDAGGGGRPGRGQGLLHGGQHRWRGGQGVAGSAVAGLGGASAAQQHPHGPGQDGSAGQPGDQPGRGGLTGVVVAGLGGVRVGAGARRCGGRARRRGTRFGPGRGGWGVGAGRVTAAPLRGRRWWRGGLRGCARGGPVSPGRRHRWGRLRAGRRFGGWGWSASSRRR